MKAESVKCPNCGGNLCICPGIKQTYCQYCNSLLIIDNDERDTVESKTPRDDSDNPISVESVPNIDLLSIGALSDRKRSMHVLMGISYLQNTHLPFKTEDVDLWEVYMQPVKKTIFGDKKGKWECIQALPQNADPKWLKEFDVTYTKIDCEPYETIADYSGAPDHPRFEKRIKHTVKYDTKVKPDAIKSFPELYSIVSNGKSNQYIQNMLSAIVNDIENMTRDDQKTVGINVKKDLISIYFSQKPGHMEYKFHTFSLSDCSSVLHHCAMLAMVVDKILERLGDRFALSCINTRIDDDGPEYDLYECSLSKVMVAKKNYSNW